MRILERLTSIPKWRLYIYAGVAVFGLTYLVWCRFSTKPIKPGEVRQAETAHSVANMDRKIVTPARLQVFTPKSEAVKRLKLPAQEAAVAQEEVFEATEAPASRHGTTTVTFVNMTTGKPRTVIRANEAPWFSFERGNVAGVEVGLGSHGRYFQGDYQRDIFQIKGVYVGARGSVTSYPSDTDWRLGVRTEYRW